MFNRIQQHTKTDDLGVKNVISEPRNFSLTDLPAANLLFRSLLSNAYQVEKLALLMEMESGEEKRVLQMVDNILRYPTMKRF